MKTIKKHIAETYRGGYKTLCGRKATTINEAIESGFMSMVSPENKNACKTCQEIMSNARYWREYRRVSIMKTY